MGNEIGTLNVKLNGVSLNNVRILQVFGWFKNGRKLDFRIYKIKIGVKKGNMVDFSYRISLLKKMFVPNLKMYKNVIRWISIHLKECLKLLEIYVLGTKWQKVKMQWRVPRYHCLLSNTHSFCKLTWMLSRIQNETKVLTSV